MTVVEIAFYRNYVYVFPLLRAHLQLLHFRNAFVGIKSDNFNAACVFKSFEGGFARIAACRHQNQNLFFYPAQIAPLAQKVREHGKRHIFKRARRTVEKFQHVHAVFHFYKGGGIVPFELSIRLFQRRGKFVPVVFVEIFMQNERSAFGIIHCEHFFQLFPRNRGEFFGHEQSAVFCKTLHDRARAAYLFRPSGADKIHSLYSLCVLKTGLSE